MFLRSRILCLYAESALHPGSGAGLGPVDLPVQRERSTGYPIIQASGVKGALRSYAPQGPEVEGIFGPSTDNPGFAGAISPGDARLLLFPVRALRGAFVWVTSCEVLARFQRDAAEAGYPDLPDCQNGPAADQAWVSDSGLLLGGNQIMLEEYSFWAEENRIASAWAEYLASNVIPNTTPFAFWQERLQNSLVILPTDAFRDFVLYSTEIVTRIRLSPETKTVIKGALFTQELLPSETVMYSLVNATEPRNWIEGLSAENAGESADNVLNWIAVNINPRIQIGGDETVGRGLVHLHWLGWES